MNSKEALELIKLDYGVEPQGYEIIKHDLEVLEILKKYCYIQKEDSFMGKWEQINCWLSNEYKYFKDFEKVKDWLEK